MVVDVYNLTKYLILIDRYRKRFGIIDNRVIGCF